MFGNISVFKVAHAMATHAVARQNVVAQNMAHADTPGYAARRVVSFERYLSRDRSVAQGLATSRALHLNATDGNAPEVLIDETQLPDPNGNSISLEGEMLRAVDIKTQHDRALAIYKSSLSMMRLTLGRR